MREIVHGTAPIDPRSTFRLALSAREYARSKRRWEPPLREFKTSAELTES